MVDAREGGRQWQFLAAVGAAVGLHGLALPFLRTEGVGCAFVRPNVLPLLLLLGVLAGCSAEQYRQSPEGMEAASEQAIVFERPISNLRDEGFVPLPGMRDVYYIPDTDLIVKCDRNFKLNLSLKRTFNCYYLDRRLRKIQGSDFAVQINPFYGDEGFSPYR